MVCSLSPATGLDLARESRDWRNRPLTALDAVGTSYKDGNTLLDSGASVAKMAEAIEINGGVASLALHLTLVFWLPALARGYCVRALDGLRVRCGTVAI